MAPVSTTWASPSSDFYLGLSLGAVVTRWVYLGVSVPPQTSSPPTPAGPGARSAQPRPRSRGGGEMPERAARRAGRFHPDPGGGNPGQDLRGPDPEPSRRSSQINGVGGLG